MAAPGPLCPGYDGAVVSARRAAGAKVPNDAGADDRCLPGAHEPGDTGDGPASPRPQQGTADWCWSRGRNLTFILLRGGPGRKAGAGGFSILGETTQLSVGKATEGRSLIFSVQGNTGLA